MNLTQIAVIGAGISFTGLGLLARKQQHKNWLAFFLGGIAMLLFAFLSLAFGFSL